MNPGLEKLHPRQGFSMNELRYGIVAEKIYTEEKIIENGMLIIESNRIAGIVGNQDPSQVDKIYDFSAMQIIPGLIDTHIHGAKGYDTMDGDFTSLNEISKFLGKNGITAFVPTTVTDELTNIKKALLNIQDCMGKVDGAQILGAYIEGPYLGVQHRGAHPEKLIRTIELKEIEELLAGLGPTVQTVALAPDKENSLALIKYLRTRGIHVSMGHTHATYEQVEQGVTAGANIAVHIYNGMRGLHHREPGVVGAALVNDNIYTELIADFIHVHSVAMEILLRCKPKDKVVLISDAMQATGLPNGQYQLGTLGVTVEDGIVRTKDGSLAGSTITILQSVHGLIQKMGVDPLTAVQMASLNPSQLLGMEQEIGSIKIGKQADFVVVDQNFEVQMTVIQGKIIYQK